MTRNRRIVFAKSVAGAETQTDNLPNSPALFWPFWRVGREERLIGGPPDLEQFNAMKWHFSAVRSQLLIQEIKNYFRKLRFSKQLVNFGRALVVLRILIGGKQIMARKSFVTLLNTSELGKILMHFDKHNP